MQVDQQRPLRPGLCGGTIQAHVGTHVFGDDMPRQRNVVVSRLPHTLQIAWAAIHGLPHRFGLEPLKPGRQRRKEGVRLTLKLVLFLFRETDHEC